MTKHDLIRHVAGGDEDGRLTLAQSTRAVERATEGIKRALASGERVNIHGLGSFSVTTRQARQGRNPRTGESVDIPEKRAVKFTPGAALKEAVK